MGEYSVLDLGIVPRYGRAETVNLDWNIPCIALPVIQYYKCIPPTHTGKTLY